ncbi:SHOCT domain-containing protein [Ramlibacter rhizophilus]|uniref:SHOCT domain-containing protein n=1 Tax=Ramlibacter rhizophilus TaxID=1781167 RepID=A0A4Z0BI37_9BURK|nr:SHOCT domain-containing protein [Ramlibacter rhizophilus]TFY98440.1 hypothetical protein EZ242_12890 [Ramlibacter rhizophilus]
MMWGWDTGGAGWGIGFAVMHLLWWLVLVGAGALLLRWILRDTGSRGGDQPRRASAEDVLRERFARGEIDQREYEERLRVLRS